MICLCDKCIHTENCPAKAEYGGAKRCSAFKPQETTNEEWIKQCNTEQLAELIYEIAVTDKLMDRFFNAEIVYGHSGTEEAMDWLKEVHQ